MIYAFKSYLQFIGVLMDIKLPYTPAGKMWLYALKR